MCKSRWKQKYHLFQAFNFTLHILNLSRRVELTNQLVQDLNDIKRKPLVPWMGHVRIG